MPAAWLVIGWMLGDQPSQAHPALAPAERTTISHAAPQAGGPMRGVKKQHLPTKICAACGRPFAWRKSLARTWEQVKYCSDACRRFRASGGKPPR